MNYPNTPQLADWLRRDPVFRHLAAEAVFEFDDKEYEQHLVNVMAGMRPQREWRDAAAYRCITYNKQSHKSAALAEQVKDSLVEKAHAFIGEDPIYDVLSAMHHT